MSNLEQENQQQVIILYSQKSGIWTILMTPKLNISRHISPKFGEWNKTGITVKKKDLFSRKVVNDSAKENWEISIESKEKL